MTEELVLWGVGTSRTMRAHWMMLELDLDYQCRPIRSRSGETSTEEFLKINPRHKIPALQHGSFTVTESAAIIQYLSETFSGSGKVFVPSRARERAALNEWCYYIMTELDAGSPYITRKHGDLARVYGAAPTAVAAAKEYFSQNLAAMTSKLNVNEFLLGERISAADILLTTCLDWATTIGIELPNEARDYRNRITRRPAYSQALNRNFPQQAK